MAQYTKIRSLDEFMDGQITERFSVELDRVTKNCTDPNTDPRAKRIINIQIAFTPNEDRTAAQSKVTVTSKLAPFIPVSKTILIALDNDGCVIATEKSNQIPGQVDMEGNVHIPKMISFGKE